MFLFWFGLGFGVFFFGFCFVWGFFCYSFLFCFVFWYIIGIRERPCPLPILLQEKVVSELRDGVKKVLTHDRTADNAQKPSHPSQKSLTMAEASSKTNRFLFYIGSIKKLGGKVPTSAALLNGHAVKVPSTCLCW